MHVVKRINIFQDFLVILKRMKILLVVLVVVYESGKIGTIEVVKITPRPKKS